MLLRNKGTSGQCFGNYTLRPKQWDFLPESAVQAVENDPQFEPLPKAQTSKPDVVIFSGCPMDTTGGGQHPTQIAKALQGLGHRVLYVQIAPYDGPEIENLFVFQDRAIFRHSKLSDLESEKLAEVLTEFGCADKKIALFTFPSEYLHSAAKLAKKCGYSTAYWCLDDWAEINKAQNQTNYNPEVEQRIVVECDHVLATAETLAEKIRAEHHVPVTVVKNGFSRKNFPSLTGTVPRPRDLMIGAKTFVYWGELQGRWIDWGLIDAVATQHPTWTFNLIGPYEQAAKKLNRPNVFYLGEKPVSELYKYGANADFGFIPFLSNDLTAAVNPIKAYEYLAAGLPVISTVMPELNRVPYTFQHSNDSLSFREAVLKAERSRLYSWMVYAFLTGATWEKRASAFLKATSGK